MTQDAARTAFVRSLMIAAVVEGFLIAMGVGLWLAFHTLALLIGCMALGVAPVLFVVSRYVTASKAATPSGDGPPSQDPLVQ